MSSVFSGIGNAIGGIFGGSGNAGQTDPSQAQFNDPMQGYYGFYNQQLYDLWQDPSKFLASNPQYQFNKQQGLDAASGSAAARGMFNSGNTLSSLTSFASGLASNEFASEEGMLASLARGNPAYGRLNLEAQGMAAQQAQQGYSNIMSFIDPLGTQGILGTGSGSAQSASNIMGLFGSAMGAP